MQVAKHGAPNVISHAIGYAKHRNRSHDAVIRVYDDAGNVIETHENKGDFKTSLNIALISHGSLPRSEDELRDLNAALGA